MGSKLFSPNNLELPCTNASNVCAWDVGIKMFNDYESREDLHGFAITPHLIHLGGYGIYRYLQGVGELKPEQGFYRNVEDVEVLCVDGVGPGVQVLLNETARVNSNFRFVDEENSSPYRSVIRVRSVEDIRVVFHHQNWRGDIDYYRYTISPKFPNYRILVRPAQIFESINTPHPIDLFLLKLDVVSALQRGDRVFNHDLDLAVLLKHWLAYRLEIGEGVNTRLREIFRALQNHFTEPTPISESDALLLVFRSSLIRYLRYYRDARIPDGFGNIFPNFTEVSDLIYRIDAYITSYLGIKNP